jgi:hypothetical protein
VRRLAFTLSETIVMTRLASGPRQSVEALSFLRSRNDAAPLPAALVRYRKLDCGFGRNRLKSVLPPSSVLRWIEQEVQGAAGSLGGATVRGFF